MDQPQLFTDSRYLFMHRIELVEGGVHQQPGSLQPARHSRGGRPVTNPALVNTTSPSHCTRKQYPNPRADPAVWPVLARSLVAAAVEDKKGRRGAGAATRHRHPHPGPAAEERHLFFFPASQPARALRSTIAFASSDRVPRHTRRGGSGTTGGPRRTAHSSSRSCGAG